MWNAGWSGLFVASMIAVPCAAQAQEPAGRILWTFGQVERVGADGVAKRVAAGDPVFEGDLIRSAPASQAQLVMNDEALMAVRADSSVKLAAYVYNGREDGTERAVVELLKGGLRSVTGAIGRNNKDSYQLKSNHHTVGIRGTDHETFADDTGTFNRVSVGGTYLQGEDGRVDLSPGDVGFASHVPGGGPTRLDRTPDFMHVAVLTSGNTGPQFRDRAPRDSRRLQNGAVSSNLSLQPSAASPVLPVQALGDNAKQNGFGKGGSCDALCFDPLKGSNGKGHGKGGSKGGV